MPEGKSESLKMSLDRCVMSYMWTLGLDFFRSLPRPPPDEKAILASSSCQEARLSQRVSSLVWLTVDRGAIEATLHYLIIHFWSELFTV